MPDGVLLIDKPSGPTSHDVVARIRRVDRGSRAGHTGTLDPLATGLLVVCLGQATRLQQFLTGLDKVYSGEIRLGRATTTWDAEGEPTDPRGDATSLDDARIGEAARAFVGELDQAPPPYSARKIAGKRFYEIARAGGEVPRTSKRIRIHRFSVAPRAGELVPFELEGSSGTYVRSVAHELGAALGVGAHLASLRRRSIGPFRLEDATALDAWLNLAPESRFTPPHFLSIDCIPLPFPRICIDARQCGLVVNGQAVLLRGATQPEGALVALTDEGGRLVAIGEASSGESWFSVQPKLVLASSAERH